MKEICGYIAVYSIEVAILMTVLTAVYLIAVRPIRSPGLQRGVIVGIMVVSLAAPLWLALYARMRSGGEGTGGAIEIGLPIVIASSENAASAYGGFDWRYSLVYVIAAGAFLTLAISLPGWWRVVRGIAFSRKRRLGPYIIAVTAPGSRLVYSWGRWIVCPEDDLRHYGKMILAHEAAHLRRLHWIDLLIGQFTVAVNWYNPAAWLLLEYLRDAHEYTADRDVLRRGASRKEYACMLIEKAVGKPLQLFADSLNHSQLKKRLTMMKNQNQSRWRRLGAAAMLPALAAGVAFAAMPQVSGWIDSLNPRESAVASVSDDKVSENFADLPVAETEAPASERKEKKQEENLGGTARELWTDTSETAKTDTPPAIYVDGKKTDMKSIKELDPASIAKIDIKKMPDGTAAINVTTVNTPEGKAIQEKAKDFVLAEYKGGHEALQKALYSTLRYPKEAQEAGIGGVAVVQLEINANGKVQNTSISRSSGNELLDAEALRATKTLNDWEPLPEGTETTKFFLPVKFKVVGN